MSNRCSWCGEDPIYVKYHDEVWGVPEYDSKALFAKLILDGAQAGLSWITILKRQEHYYKLFDGLDPQKMALYDQKKIDELLLNPGIIRNKLKVNAAVGNAQAYIELEKQGVDFSEWLWSFVQGKPLLNSWNNITQVPSTSAESDKMSKALKKEGFKFVGSTIVYAFMQAVGMVNDHVMDCPRWKEVQLDL